MSSEATPSPEQIEALSRDVLARLRARPEGLSEHSLLRALAEDHPRSLGDPFAGLLATFRAHFLLFHVLYALRDELRGRGEAELLIDPLGIRLVPARPGRPGISADDPVRSFYADLSQLGETDEDAVARLLAGFYARLHGGAGRAEALGVLGLEDPVSDGEIKAAYRRLAQQAHPDRGGDTERIQALNAALRRLMP